MENDKKMARKSKFLSLVFFIKCMCQIYQIWTFLRISLKNIERNLVFSHKDLSVSIKVFSRGFRLWGLRDMSTCFFSSLFTRRTIFSRFGMILKRENNFSEPVKWPSSQRGQKVSMLTPMEIDSKMARKRVNFVWPYDSCYKWKKKVTMVHLWEMTWKWPKNESI